MSLSQKITCSETEFNLSMSLPNSNLIMDLSTQKDIINIDVSSKTSPSSNTCSQISQVNLFVEGRCIGTFGFSTNGSVTVDRSYDNRFFGAFCSTYNHFEPVSDLGHSYTCARCVEILNAIESLKQEKILLEKNFTGSSVLVQQS